MSAPEGDRNRAASTRYLAAIRQQWFLIVAIALIGVGVGVVHIVLTPKSYEASSDVLVTPISTSDTTFDGFALLRDSAGPGSSVLTAARLLTTPAAAAAVRRQIGVSATPRELLSEVSAEPIGQANILSVVGKSSSPGEAARIANAFAAHLVRERTALFQTQLQARITQLRRSLGALPASGTAAAAIEAQLAALDQFRGEPDPTLQVARPATAPYTPSSPRVGLSLAAALISSLVLGFAVAIGMEAFGRTVSSESELRDLGWIPVLARVPAVAPETMRSLRDGELPRSVWDAYRLLTVSLGVANAADVLPRSFLVTGATSGEGKTTVAASLATAFLLEGLKVTTVDAEPSAGESLADLLGADATRPDFNDVFRPHAVPNASSKPAPSPRANLQVVVAPVDTRRGFAPLDIRSFQHGLQHLRQDAELIVVDAPAATNSADALVMAAAVDAVLVVVRIGHTCRSELKELRDALTRHAPAPVGFIVVARGRRSSRARRPGRRATAANPSVSRTFPGAVETEPTDARAM